MGNNLNNTITGNSAGNILNGGAGADTLVGGNGNDDYYLSDADDVIIEFIGAGTDTVFVTQSYTLTDVNLENIKLNSGADINATGNNLGNTITPGKGNNILDGADGFDIVDYTFASGAVTVDLALTGAQATGGSGSDTFISIEAINGSLFNDKLSGNDEVNRLIGDNGNDTLFGGAGNDNLEGGQGVDSLDGGSGLDVVSYSFSSNGSLVNLKTGVVTNDGYGNTESIANVESVIGSNVGNDHITLSDVAGNATGFGGNDTLIGGAGNDTLSGVDGADILDGADGNDSLFGGAGSDEITSGAGVDVLDGGADFDTISFFASSNGAIINLKTNMIANDGYGNAEAIFSVESVIGSDNGNDQITLSDVSGAALGHSGNDTLIGGTGKDHLDGGVGNDLLNGGSGNDTMIGDAGSDTYYVDNDGDSVIEDNADANMGGIDLVFSSLANYTLTANVENGSIAIGGSANLSGNALNNILSGNSGNNLLNGGDGIDAADYSNSNAAVTAELWRGTASNDGLGGSDTLQAIENLIGSAFNDLLGGTEAANSLSGMNGNDALFAGGGNDTLLGGLGNDLLAGGAGVDSIDGGSGSDTADYGSATAGIVAELWRGTASKDGQGSNDVLLGIEHLNGGGFNDLLAGDESANLLNAQAGDDSLFAGGGADTLQGGAGNDLLAGGSGIDSLDGGAGIDTADYGSATAAVIAELWRGTASNDGQGGNDVLVNIENLNGGGFNDLLVGNEAVNLLNAQAGNDTLFGGGGNDTLFGGEGIDLLSGGAGNDSIDGGAGVGLAEYGSASGAVTAELWRGTASNDGQGGNDVLLAIENLAGGAFNDLLAGNESANTLYGQGGHDNIFAGGGNDTVFGGAGNDLIAGGAGVDNINGGDGIDTADYRSATSAVTAEIWRGTAANDGQGGNDTLAQIENLIGSNFNDLLAGNEAANSLNGGAGNDNIYAGGGADTINGGSSNDNLFGNGGADTFRFDTALNAATNLDNLGDFVVVDDTISLAGSIFSAITPGTLGAGNLRAGAGLTTAADADDFIIYNSSTGALYYDADGSGVGATVQFAVLPVGLALTNADFVVA